MTDKEFKQKLDDRFTVKIDGVVIKVPTRYRTRSDIKRLKKSMTEGEHPIIDSVVVNDKI